ncbi:hypothetical protein A2316_01135 [Candidatus Falkowbacteria bacterium RIFOXYB2_FULL_38_15]|uniref:HTH psq-type domain-containing protein n=1 Tax=Candidatus Falkowbacteria bacterium RIFOXYA2_FULL_38_12 TaxID=1797993 RepID=A0A1F5S5V7_9BACT|nr:MAG: hypothetical protein A2257_02540 [Candidatus Falkowbacteria bacterium RIFOXYA2_FULL_38_12]OGF32791.1 MAG: hypothetical protein A2316_01135 [Candidatus Falkowbacteria bacterium RIFOXYB2_FULL_38_15]OGF42173.1 MAG: hypothetical protein A2555_02760 [Candidatus Falkowbacteria bacterium RIFOXYD2_FULL_39_16]
MSRLIDREKALSLRKEGKSYSQIKSILKIPKSTLSGWLHDLPLTNEQINLLRGSNSEIKIEKFRETMRHKRIAKLEKILKERKKILPLSQRELFLCGLFLYLGEGSKSERSKLSITNTDPDIIEFTLLWFTKILKIPRKKIRIDLQLYQDMNASEKTNFWSKKLNMPTKQFNKPYIKSTSGKRINHKGSFGQGTCAISFYNVNIKDKVMMSLRGIMTHYLS